MATHHHRECLFEEEVPGRHPCLQICQWLLDHLNTHLARFRGGGDGAPAHKAVEGWEVV